MSIPVDASTLADLSEGIRDRLLKEAPKPALQLFPPLSDRDLKELRVSVEARGLRVPVELDSDGRVLDGHHRLQVARELEIEAGEIPVTVRDDLSDEDDTLEYILEVNLGRRHLTREERRQVARALRAREWSLRRIANRVGVSHETIRRDLDAGVTYMTGEGGGGPSSVEGHDGKSYPANRSSGSSSDGSGSGGRDRLPGHAQGRGRGPAAGSRNGLDGRCRQQDVGRSRSDDRDSRSEPDRDPRIDLLNRADALLSKTRRLTPEEESEVRDELEALGDRLADLVAEIAKAGDGWVV